MDTASLRKAYGESLVELGRENGDLVVLEADLGKSTMSCLFKETFPERYFEMGIAEANMISAAAGLSFVGKKPFCSTFAVFAAGRAYDQIRCSIAVSGAKVTICGSSCGLSDFGDGKTHQSIEDANIIKSIPHMTVLNPCDAVEVKKMMRAIMAHMGPVYIRINRNDLPVYTPPGGEYQIGTMYPLCSGDDAVIFATGVMVSKSMEAAEKLKAEGIAATVVNVSTLKPLHQAEALQYAAGKKALVVAEEAVQNGGLGDTIARLLINEITVPFTHIAIDDAFGTSAHNYEELLVQYGLTSERVYQAVKKGLGNRRG